MSVAIGAQSGEALHFLLRRGLIVGLNVVTWACFGSAAKYRRIVFTKLW